jgi:hypothetical protein
MSKEETKARVAELLAGRPEAAERLARLRNFSRKVRACEVHLTTACNIRCEGCWYFEFGFDKESKDVSDPKQIRAFAEHLKESGVTQATLIGGEPTIVPQRIEPFVDNLPYVLVSTNGLRPLPMAGFENVGIGVSMFGGGPLDDDLRAIRVSGKKFTGLFDTALKNYTGDPRVAWVYALTERGLPYIEESVRRIHENGNIVCMNFYSEHGTDTPLRLTEEQRLLDEVLRVKELYPDTILNPPYYLRALITGRSHWGATFGYDVCPSISVDLPVHADRIANGNPVLTGFTVWGADYETKQFCCTSGECHGCRDSQAVYSWLLVSMSRFLDDAATLDTWMDIAESYWHHWVWSDYHATRMAAPAS